MVSGCHWKWFDQQQSWEFPYAFFMLLSHWFGYCRGFQQVPCVVNQWIVRRSSWFVSHKSRRKLMVLSCSSCGPLRNKAKSFVKLLSHLPSVLYKTQYSPIFGSCFFPYTILLFYLNVHPAFTFSLIVTDPSYKSKVLRREENSIWFEMPLKQSETTKGAI